MSKVQRIKRERAAERDTLKQSAKGKNTKNGVIAAAAVVTAVAIVTAALTVSALMPRKASPLLSVNPMSTVTGTSMRLDKHQGMMIPGAKTLMAYYDYELQDKVNHFICPNDWYDIIESPSSSTAGSIQLRYPITMPNGIGDVKEIRWFNGVDWLANSDGKAGSFSIGYDQTNWYKNIPVGSVITYNDDRSDNGAEIFISNNTGFTVEAGLNNNSSLWCGAKEVMWPTALPVTYCYYNHGDYTDADWGWQRNQQGWSTAGLVQGTNTVYLAGTDASANYTTGSVTFLYDNVAPYVNEVSISNVTASGYDFNIVGAGDATSGIDKFVIYTWSNDGTRHSSTATYNGTQKDGLNQTAYIPATDGGGQNDRTDLYVYDKAGNVYFISSSTTATSSSSSDSSSSETSSSAPLESLNPVANFTVGTPVAVGVALQIKDYSTAGADDAYIDQEEWSYSTDGGKTWSDPTSTPPTSFTLSEFPATTPYATYTIRLRVHAAWREGTPEANAEESSTMQPETLVAGKWSSWGDMKTVPKV
jgi:hypothetical protein